MIFTLSDLSFILERYYKIQDIEEIRNYLTKQDENLLIISESALTLILNPENKGKLEILSKEIEKIKQNAIENITMDELQELIEELKKNELDFYKDVIFSDNPNFLITSYYSLYLHFVLAIYSKLKEDKNLMSTGIFLVGLFGIPVLLYIKKKEVSPYISELSGILLHVLVTAKSNG
ncbi:hypothetical protein AVT98_gp67 [Sulfolobales virus YNP1]|uniref:hypothetical protein n=1 Tax=Sulfolobales virus YNP1 TaxID=1732179 RepID=UPI00070645E3|nr:hypothetical protein AVT98_gp67 [Sulfolobales virus YNP1]ALG97159.1 hypothetical protein [Sulfolobales virus YNP1]